MVPFPTRAFVQNEFFTTVASVFTFIFSFSFLYPASRLLRAEEYYNFTVDQGSRNLKDASSAAALHGPVSHETLTRSAAMVVSRSGDGGPVSSPDSCPKASSAASGFLSAMM